MQCVRSSGPSGRSPTPRARWTTDGTTRRDAGDARETATRACVSTRGVVTRARAFDRDLAGGVEATGERAREGIRPSVARPAAVRVGRSVGRSNERGFGDGAARAGGENTVVDARACFSSSL